MTVLPFFEKKESEKKLWMSRIPAFFSIKKRAKNQGSHWKD